MKYLKRYNELNEGLRDKMKPKSEEDIFKTLKHLDLNQLKQKFLQMWLQYNFQHRVDNKAFSNYVHSIIGRDLWEEKKQKYIDGGLKDLRYLEFNMKFSVSPEILLYDAELSKEELIKLIISSYSELNEGIRDKMMPKSEDELLSSLNKLPDNERILKIFKYNLNLDLLPRDEDGWCVFTDDYTPHYYNNVIPDKFKIVGGFYASGSEDITELPNDLYVKDNFILSGSKITEIPDGLFVGKNLVINRNNIEKLPDDLTVNGDLDASSNKLTQLPKNLTIKGVFSCNWNKLVEIPNDLIVGGDANFNMNNIKKINKGVKFGGNVDILSNQITKLPDDLHINGTLNLMDNKLTKLPKGLIVKGDLVIMGNKIKQLPEDLIVEGSIYIDSEFKKIINIPKGVNNIL